MMLNLRHWSLMLAIASCIGPAPASTTHTTTSSLSSIPGKYQALGAAAQQQPKKLKIGAEVGATINASSLGAVGGGHKPVFRQNPIKNWLGSFNRNNSPAAQNQTSPTCSCRCGERNDESRIVGGTTAGVSEYPWMARLSYFNRFYCGGTLINDRYVLTAAHCVKGFMWFMIKVTFGEHDRCNDKERPETRFVLRAFSQKFSFSNFDNDIALLRLNDRVPITSFIRPICLPRVAQRNELFVGTRATATGWGTLKEDGKPSCLLQEVEVPVLDNEECVAQTNYTQKMITKNMMCSGYPGVGGRDSCQGDSGGPLVRMRPDDKRFEQIGIVSWGNGCARPNYPGVYTRVTKYLDWIVENSRDGCFCDEDY
ncbi:venom protease [Drosophila guanche]|uniref:Blast:Plasma kallikrein n=1 Tax=Drosophila guanche TaxID=7266 RepID=A0A3B0J394_DROGU|nr:venom protease [Drosophila guanche]SPP76064.1 blast:Plasma kallikrein [Drosophila guanche]